MPLLTLLSKPDEEVHGEVDTETKDRHAEEGLHHGEPPGRQANHAERPSGQFEADEFLLSRLDRLVQSLTFKILLSSTLLIASFFGLLVVAELLIGEGPRDTTGWLVDDGLPVNKHDG